MSQVYLPNPAKMGKRRAIGGACCGGGAKRIASSADKPPAQIAAPVSLPRTVQNAPTARIEFDKIRTAADVWNHFGDARKFRQFAKVYEFGGEGLTDQAFAENLAEIIADENRMVVAAMSPVNSGSAVPKPILQKPETTALPEPKKRGNPNFRKKND